MPVAEKILQEESKIPHTNSRVYVSRFTLYKFESMKNLKLQHWIWKYFYWIFGKETEKILTSENKKLKSCGCVIFSIPSATLIMHDAQLIV